VFVHHVNQIVADGQQMRPHAKVLLQPRTRIDAEPQLRPHSCNGLVGDHRQGARRGNNPRMLPKTPTFETAQPFVTPRTAIRVSGQFKLPEAVTLDGVMPERVPPGHSIQIVAALPTGSIEPLVWLYEYDDRYEHPFLFRRPIQLPAGTIHGVPSDAIVMLLPVANRQP
jgi:hypothetical protein